MTDSLYVKLRGRVIGPFEKDRLLQMIQQGQLSRASLVSSDGDSWQKAGSVSSLFRQDGKGASRVKAVETSANGGSQQKSDEIWHYGSGTESHGPVTVQAIQELIANGKVGPNDTVWQQGMEDWEPVSNVGEFVEFFSDTESSENSAATQSGTIAKNESSIGNAFAETARLTTASAPWVSLISVVTFISSAVLFFGSLFILIKGAQAQSVILITNGVLGFVQVTIMIGGAMLLNRYAAGCRKFQHTNQPVDLYDALVWLGKFWVLAGLVMIMVVIISVIALIFSYATTGATFSQ